MELNIFKHNYFVIVSFRYIYDRKGSMLIYCRAKDIRETILSKLPKDEENVVIETITKLD